MLLPFLLAFLPSVYSVLPHPRDAMATNYSTPLTGKMTYGGCEWFGTAPICWETCPAGYDYIREHSGRCEDGRPCPPDPSFGEACFNVFGYQLTKKFCCRSDPDQCQWSGRWSGSHDNFSYYCRFDSTIGRCGRISCSVNAQPFQAHNASLIGGDDCDELFLWGLYGKASCGYIAWFKENKLLNSWYKA